MKEIEMNMSFRLLTEYHSFLCVKNIKVMEELGKSQFPSPYGVLFILIKSTFINKRKITN